MVSISKLTSRDFHLQNIDVSSANVDNKGKPIVLFIKASYCGHCTNFVPTFAHLSKQFKKIKFCALEYTENQALLNQWKQLAHPSYQVDGFPTIVLYDGDGNPIKVVQDRMNMAPLLKDLA